MNINYAVYNKDTGVILWCANVPEKMFDETKLGGPAWIGEANPELNYINLSDLSLGIYTEKELADKAKAINGYVWKMPERILLDQRTLDDVKAEVVYNRINSYPPISDFADAMYHQANGNNIPMEEYLAKVKAVKEQFPKPSEA